MRSFILLAAMVLTDRAEAGDTLNRVTGAWQFGPTPVWTDATTNPVFHPLSAPMSAVGILKVRVSYQLSELAGPCRIRPAVRYSNNGATWDDAVPIDATDSPYVNTNTIDYGSVYVDVTTLASSTPRSWIQFGVQAANASGAPATVGFCNATLRVEPAEDTP